MKKKVLALVLCLAMVLSVLPMSVFAVENESIPYIDRTWDGEEVVEIERQVTNYETVTSSTKTMSAGTFYVVSGDVTISSRIVIEGTTEAPTSIILTDGCTLNALSGIQLHSGKVLNIYGQTNDTGELKSKINGLSNEGVCYASIGGNKNASSGSLTVYGGNITSFGGHAAAGIGGGDYGGNADSFVMYGGTVEAKGGTNGRGIGAGYAGKNNGKFNVYGDVSIVSGDAAPGTETTVSGYANSRNRYVKITQNKEHIWKAVNPVSPVYCTQSVNCDIECSVCHEAKSVVLNATKTHSWQTNSITLATCTEPYTSHLECTACHTNKDYPIGKPNGHSWETTLYAPATCTSAAVNKTECSVCHEFYLTEEGYPISHNFVNDYCTVCGKSAFEFVERYWNGSKVVETLKSLNGINYQDVTAETTTFENGIYYIVRGDITNENRIVANGTAHLILADDCNFNIKNGIEVPKGSKINIYGQSNDSGKMTACSTGAEATIGGSETCYYSNGIQWRDGSAGNINIHGGTFDLTSGLAAAIGSGMSASAESVTIYGGNIKINAEGLCAGIGAGDAGSINSVSIYGGIIDTKEKGDSAGIGAGWQASCSLINLGGGTITATSTGDYARAFKASKIALSLNTHAQYGTTKNDIQGELDYNSNNITSTLNDSQYAYIYHEAFDYVKVPYIVRDGKYPVYKKVSDYVIVTPFTTKFEDNKYYVVLENVKNDNRIVVSGNAHLILSDGKTLNAENGIRVTEGNSLSIYGQCADNGTLKTNEGSYSAAIGGERDRPNGDIAIHGGTIIANSNGGAGIGGGWYTTNGKIDIYGGNVTASSKAGAGIGAGTMGDGNLSKAISIYGGNVHASSKDGAGIGGGLAVVEGNNLSNHKAVAGHAGLMYLYGGSVTAQSTNASAIGGGSKTMYYVDGSSKTFYGNPAVLYMDPSITLHYGYDTNSGTRTVTTSSLSKNIGSAVNTVRYVTYTTEAPEAIHNYGLATCTEPAACTVCGATVGDPLGHDFEAISVAKPATETTPAEYHGVCRVCGEVTDSFIPKTALDSATLTDIKEGDFLGRGAVFKHEYGTSLLHTRCNIYINGDSIASIEHMGEWTATECLRCTEVKRSHVSSSAVYFESACDFTEATCTEPATCIYCGATDGEAKGHKWATATCTTPKTCTVCGEIADPTLGHDWIPATCTTPKTCTVCGATDGDPLGHDFTKPGTLVSEADCTHAAVYTAKCVRCEKTNGTIEVGKALGHNYDALYVVKPATCTEPAEYHAECTRCGDIINNYIPKSLPESDTLTNIKVGDFLKRGATFKHGYGNVLSYSNCEVYINGERSATVKYNNEWTAPECLRCTELVKSRISNSKVYFESACDYTEATFTEPKTCIYCGHTEGEPIDSLNKIMVTKGNAYGELNLMSMHDRSVVVLEAEYNKDGKMLQVDYKNVELESKEAHKYKVDFSKYTNGNNVRVFIWDNMDNITPLCDFIKFDVK